MLKSKSLLELIELHKKLKVVYYTFSVMASAFLIILIIMLLMTEKQPFKVVGVMVLIVLINAGISYLVKIYSDKVQGLINQGGSLTKS